VPLRIILDSNFLFIPLQFRVDVFEELERVANRKVEPILLVPVLEEVKMLSEKKGVKARQATAVLKYVEKLKPLSCKVKPNETVDDLIFRLAIEWKCPVATNDRTLRKRLRDINTTVIYLRQRSRLEIDGQA